MNLSQQLRARRAAQRLSQVDVAKEAGCSPATVSLLENNDDGTYDVKLTTVCRIAHALGSKLTITLEDEKPGN